MAHREYEVYAKIQIDVFVQIRLVSQAGHIIIKYIRAYNSKNMMFFEKLDYT